MNKKQVKAELKKLNVKIDKLIMAGKSYKTLAIKHKQIIKSLNII